VWESAALEPWEVRPPFIATIGFLLETFFRVLKNFSPFLIPSMYRQITFVLGSLERYSRRSDSSISVAFPYETNFENLWFCSVSMSKIAAPIAPD